MQGRLAIIDVETTGGSGVYDRIIEVGVLVVENGEIIDSFETLINPERSVPPMITSLTGIANDNLAGAPLFEDVADRITELLDGALFVAHNARFDYGFIKNEFKRIGRDFRATCVCTVRLSRRLFPEYDRHNLDSIAERFNLSCERRHRALDDARMVADFLTVCRERHGAEAVSAAIRSMQHEGSFPSVLPRGVVESLPEEPGVYLFYGEGGELLYVGKSINIAKRVRSHFSSDHTSTRESRMCQQVARIEHKVTAGELGALLLESRLIKEMKPLYNLQARRAQQFVVGRTVKNKKGYPTLELVHTRRLTAHEAQSVVCLFKNMRQAKETLSEIGKEFSLCPTLLGVATENAPCFYYQIGQCLGACAGKEKSGEYRVRFKQAFEGRRVREWPYSEAIVIGEERADGHGEFFVVDRWCVTHVFEYGPDGIEAQHSPVPLFDYDTYKILARALLSRTRRHAIRPLSQSLQVQELISNS